MKPDELLPGRVLAIDWGEKSIGLAISDETRTLAKPLGVVIAQSRQENAKRIVEIAVENDVRSIIIGVTFDHAGELTPSGRRASRLGQVIAENIGLKVTRWDESRSTQEARENQIMIGASRKKRKGHLDDKAAAVILQGYLEWERENG